MDEQKLLEAIGQMMDQKLEPINSRLETLEQGQIRTHDNLSSLNADIARLDHNIQPQLKLIQEGITGILEKYNRLDQVAGAVERYGDRIFALEQSHMAE